jgi:hypothetical protein
MNKSLYCDSYLEAYWKGRGRGDEGPGLIQDNKD